MMQRKPKTQPNDRTRAVHTRFDSIQWFVRDAETFDSYGNPGIVRQCDDFETAVSVAN